MESKWTRFVVARVRGKNMLSAGGRMGNKKMKCVVGATEGKNMRHVSRMTE